MPTEQSSSDQAGGCYGFRLHGVEGARDLLVAAPATWPALDVSAEVTERAAPAGDRIGPDAAELPFQRGWVRIERAPARVAFHLPERPPDRELVHPYLAPAAAVAARWSGRETFHAGAFVAGGGAWAVLGDKENGKSTTLARLALDGLPVVSDDLVVLAGGEVLAGPRCIDLREESARRLGVGEELGVVGARERWRLPLADVGAETPLRGWVVLGWDDELAVEPLRGPERLLALLPYRSVQLTPQAPFDLVELSALPVWRLRRPRRWDSLAEGAGRLLDALAG
jgi:hypothetical protein